MQYLGVVNPPTMHYLGAVSPPTRQSWSTCRLTDLCQSAARQSYLGETVICSAPDLCSIVTEFIDQAQHSVAREGGWLREGDGSQAAVDVFIADLFGANFTKRIRQ